MECQDGNKTATSIVETAPKLSKKGKQNFKLQRNAWTGWDGYKTAAWMVGTVPKLTGAGMVLQ